MLKPNNIDELNEEVFDNNYIDVIERLKKEIDDLKDRLADKDRIIKMQDKQIADLEHPVIVDAKKGLAS